MKINIEPLFSVEDGVTEVRERLTREKKFEFASLLANNYTRVKIIALFLALLELYKSGEIDINGENKIMIEVTTA